MDAFARARSADNVAFVQNAVSQRTGLDRPSADLVFKVLGMSYEQTGVSGAYMGSHGWLDGVSHLSIDHPRRVADGVRRINEHAIEKLAFDIMTKHQEETHYNLDMVTPVGDRLLPWGTADIRNRRRLTLEGTTRRLF